MERIKVSIGKTLNLGNYESLRLDVGMEADTLTRDRTETFNNLVTWINERLIELETKRRK